jgi:hypothetical protein
MLEPSRTSPFLFRFWLPHKLFSIHWFWFLWLVWRYQLSTDLVFKQQINMPCLQHCHSLVSLYEWVFSLTSSTIGELISNIVVWTVSPHCSQKKVILYKGQLYHSSVKAKEQVGTTQHVLKKHKSCLFYLMWSFYSFLIRFIIFHLTFLFLLFFT